MTNESHPLLREAYAVIDGIPDDRLDLAYFSNSLDPHDCGTIACAAGWLGLNPRFQALGLSLEQSTVGNVWVTGQRYLPWNDIVGRALGISANGAENIFCGRWAQSPLDPLDVFHITDKQLWLSRVRRFLLTNP